MSCPTTRRTTVPENSAWNSTGISAAVGAVVGLTVVLALVAVACGSAVEVSRAPEMPAEDSVDTGGETNGDTGGESEAANTDDREGGSVEHADPAPGTAAEDLFPGGGVHPTLVRDDIDCSEDGLGEDAESDFTVAHYVVDGSLGQVCLGESDPRLLSAWETLATITPPGQLLDLGLFGGFASGERGDEVTLAFVNPLDDDGSLFQMSVNLEAAADDPDELMLTLAHEFSHVFTAVSVQLDRFAEPETCATYDNGEGCYWPTSLMAHWIELFWADGLIDQVDPNAEASGEIGGERCEVNAGFLGPYAASNPEEDFAESFSAFVFRLPVDTPELQAKMDWFADQPGLVTFRDRAAAAGLGPLDNPFEPCG